MEDLPGAAQVWEIEREHLDAGQRLGELADAVVVRPIAASDEERALVEPERVTALGRFRALDSRGDRHARLDEVRADHLDLAAPSFLTRPEEQRALVGDERRVVDVDRVRIEALRRLRHDDLCPRVREQLPESRVLVLHPAPDPARRATRTPSTPPRSPERAAARAPGGAARSCSDSRTYAR